MPKLTDAQHREIVDLFRAGNSIKSIAEKTGFSALTVSRHVHKEMDAEVAPKAPHAAVVRMPTTSKSDPATLADLLKDVQQHVNCRIRILVSGKSLEEWMHQQREHGNHVRTHLTDRDLRLVWSDNTVAVLQPAGISFDDDAGEFAIEFRPL